MRAWAPALVVFGCALASLAPLFAARYLPFLDEPNHLGAIAIWTHYDRPEYGFARYYELNLPPVPYWAHYGVVRLLASVFPLEWANKAFLAAALLGFPLGLAAFLRAHGRPPILALAAVPLAWSYDLALGFNGYVAAVGVLLGAWALLARLDDAGDPAPPRLVAANLAAGGLLYFLHPLPFALWGVGVLLYVPRLAPLLAGPPTVLFVTQLVVASDAGLQAHEPGAGVAGRWNSLGDNLRLFHHRLLEFVAPDTRWWMLAGMLAALVLAVGLISRDARRRDHRPLVLAAAVATLYLILPEHLYRPLNWWMINGRIPLVLALVAFACVPPGTLQGWRAALVCAPLVVMSVAYPTAIATRFADFDRRAEDFRALVARLPMDPAVLTLVYPPQKDRAVHVAAWRHFASYVQVERGGYNPHAWANGFPMRERPEAARPAPGLASRPDWFDWDAHARAYEWFLVRNATSTLFAGHEHEVELVAERGAWRLWRRRGLP